MTASRFPPRECRSENRRSSLVIGFYRRVRIYKEGTRACSSSVRANAAVVSGIGCGLSVAKLSNAALPSETRATHGRETRTINHVRAQGVGSRKLRRRWRRRSESCTRSACNLAESLQLISFWLSQGI